MLEARPGSRIATAALAAHVGVSEAALYRHFPSKSKMFEGLIEFIEEAVFDRINLIAADANLGGLQKCERVVHLLLLFSERNPGISRLLTGNVLAGENARLQVRIVQFFNRVEAHLKQILRDAELREDLHLGSSVSVIVNLWMALAEGRLAQFVRSEFKAKPTQGWELQWAILNAGLQRQITASALS